MPERVARSGTVRVGAVLGRVQSRIDSFALVGVASCSKETYLGLVCCRAVMTKEWLVEDYVLIR